MSAVGDGVGHFQLAGSPVPTVPHPARALHFHGAGTADNAHPSTYSARLYQTARLTSSTISKRSGASPTAPSAEAPLRVATVALLLARAACAICATRGLRDIDAGCVVRRVRRLSASKEKKWVFWTYRPRGVFFVFGSTCCSFFSIPARIRGAFSGIDPRTRIFRRIGSTSMSERLSDESTTNVGMLAKCESSRVEMSKHVIGVEKASPLMPNSRTNHNNNAGGGEADVLV